MNQPPLASPPATSEPTRRVVLTTGATLLAGFGLAVAGPASSTTASTLFAAAGQPVRKDLAANRPVTVSTTDYAPTPGPFAVDGLADTGVAGTGWRAAQGDPQWIAVDLQAPCSIESVTLIFEAALDTPAFDGNYATTVGTEVLSSAAVAFQLETSTNGKKWTTVYQTTAGTGAQMDLTLDNAVTARWIRLTSTKRSNPNPVGLNSFQVYGTSSGFRPEAVGWTSWGVNRTPAPALAVAPDGTVPLESGWALTLDGFTGAADGAALSAPSLDTSAWLPATVPGTVLGSLVDQKHFPDPVSGFNNLQIPEALSRHSWWYRREFTLPRTLDAGPGRHIWLEFDGITQTAEVWVNGTNVGSVPNPFQRGVFDVTAALAPSARQQAVAVRVNPMAHPGTPGDKSDNGNTFVQSARLYLDSPTFLAASGWDWMPAVRDRGAGLADHVRLRSTGSLVIGDPRVVTTLPNLPQTDVAEVTITVPVTNVGSRAATTTVQASFGEVKVRRSASVPAGASTDVVFTPSDFAALRVAKPRLWWPNGYGDPALYDLTMTVSTGGSVSDRRVTRFGIRQFGYASHEPVVVPPSGSPTFIVPSGSDDPGQIVNFDTQRAQHVRIQCGRRATGYGFSLYRLAVVSSAAPSVDLALHAAATASSAGTDWGTPDKVVDGDNTTRWASDYADNQWIQVDLGSTRSFDRVEVAWEAAYALTFIVQTSPDGATWTDAKAVDNNTALGDSVVQKETFPAQTAQYLRIQGGARATGYGISMWTLAAFDTAQPTTDLAEGATATASSDDGNPAANAVDGNPRTRWSSAYEDNQWIQVDFGAPTTFDQVAIDWEQAYARDYVIQVSADGGAWTDVKAVSNVITQMKISVNGVAVFCRGGNWGWDEMLRRVLPGRLAAAVRMHRDMNFTMIRNWLGSSDRDELFALCDENGLLVWNDFWQAGQFDDDVPGYIDAVTETIRRYRTHPSIVVWCGANEGNPPAHLDQGMRDAVAAEDGELIYIPNSAGGIVSGHGPYKWLEPAQYYDRSTYDTNAFGFHTEIGMPVVPVTESMQNLVGAEPGWPISEVWNYHDWSEKGNQQTGTYRAAIDARLGASTSLDEFSRRAQFVNFENHRAMFEAWNANLWKDATGLLLWMSHPAWHSTVWQTYDYDLDVNGAYYGSRKGCEPLHVQADPVAWRVVAVNHTPQARAKVTVTASLYSLAGTRLGPVQTQLLDIAPSDVAAAFTVAAPAGAPALHLVRLELRDASGALLSQNTYWRYGAPGDMGALNSAGSTRLRLSVGGARPAGDEQSATLTVTNRGRTVASMVRLSVRNRLGGRILPATYGDNYVWLLPGESRQIRASWPSSGSGRSGVHFAADAYNAPSVVTS